MSVAVTIILVVLCIVVGLWLCNKTKPPKLTILILLMSLSLWSCEDNIECESVYLEGNAKMHCKMSD